MKKVLLVALTMLTAFGGVAQRKGFKVIKRPDFVANALITVEKGAFNEKDKDLLMDYLFEYGIDVASDRFKTDDKVYINREEQGFLATDSQTSIGKIGGEKFKSRYILTTKQARKSVGHNALQIGLQAYTGVAFKIHSKKVKNIDVQILDASTGRLVCKISYYGKSIDKTYFYQRVAEELIKDGNINNSVQNVSVRQNEVDILSDKGTSRRQRRKNKRVKN